MQNNIDKQKLMTFSEENISWERKFAQAKDLRERIAAGEFKGININPLSSEGFDKARATMAEWLP